jgi:putative FmdB family regulatory protein
MPLYEYKCTACGEIISELRSASEREKPLECPTCGGEAEVILSTFATGGASQSRPGCWTSDANCGPT